MAGMADGIGGFLQTVERSARVFGGKSFWPVLVRYSVGCYTHGGRMRVKKYKNMETNQKLNELNGSNEEVEIPNPKIQIPIPPRRDQAANPKSEQSLDGCNGNGLAGEVGDEEHRTPNIEHRTSNDLSGAPRGLEMVEVVPWPEAVD